MAARMSRMIGVMSAGIVLLFGTVAWAQEGELTPREKALLERVERLEQRVVELENQKAKPAEAVVPASGPSEKASSDKGAEKKDGKDFRVFWKDGLRFETEDKAFTLSIGGKLFTDWAFFHHDEDMKIAVGDVVDGVEFRRARIDFRGTIYDNIEYRTEYDFSGDTGEAKFQDVYMGLKGIPYAGNLRVGHFKEPFNLDNMTGDNYTMFMERSLPTAFAPGRNMGVMAFNAPLNKRMTWAVGAFKNTDDFPSPNDSDEDQGFAVTARATGLPWYKEDGRKLLHIGAAYSHRNPDGAVLGYNTRPEAHLSQALVNTERFAKFRFRDARMDDVDLWNTEALLIYGPFSVQGEYTLADVSTTFGGRQDVDGYYIQAGYILTGEARSYDMAAGVPGRVKPKKNLSLKGTRGWGAWELALRYSEINL